MKTSTVLLSLLGSALAFAWWRSRYCPASPGSAGGANASGDVLAHHAQYDPATPEGIQARSPVVLGPVAAAGGYVPTALDLSNR